MTKKLRHLLAVAVATFAAGMGVTPAAFAAPATDTYPLDVAQEPLFLRQPQPPLNMLVMGKDHKLYYEAYNDSSDLNGDGAIDVGYKPNEITYFGLFDSNRCYIYGTDNIYTPTRITTNKRCGGAEEWSGDYLNYLTTGRSDALKKVLYGGTRSTDTNTRTVLERDRVPQDGHSWGKEYRSIAFDGYNIRDYAPLDPPVSGRRHLFASTSLNDDVTNPRLRILPNSSLRIWNWVSIEGPVAGDNCDPSGNGGGRGSCEVAAAATAYQRVPPEMFQGLVATQWNTLAYTSLSTVPDYPGSAAEYQTWVDYFATVTPEATRSLADIWTDTGNGGGTLVAGRNDDYMVVIKGQLLVESGQTYNFSIDGDDAVQLLIDGAVVAGWYGGHGFCNCDTYSGSYTATTTGPVNIEFRMQEKAGGDGYRMRVQRSFPESRFIERTVRVEVCKSAALKEDNCKLYPNGNLKPTGVMHDFGETNRMMFGLITGTWANNTEGGVLRKNVTSFTDEVDLNTGIFNAATTGIVKQIDALRIMNYPGTNRNNNSNYTGCGGIGFRAINNGECRDWGNPIGEMMFESLRYFSGASAGWSRYTYTTSGNDDALGLVQPAWKDPYKSIDQGGLGYQACAKPFNTVISDINPSYDTELPGSGFGTVAGPTGDPAVIGTFSASTFGQRVWDMEFGASAARTIFIGESGSTVDGAPTAKSGTSFGTLRGLSPEEPTKQGSYTAASVGYFGFTRDINAAFGDQKLQTFSVALASPLPRIVFPLSGGRVVTVIPFAKSAAHPGQTGNFRIPQDAEFRPTNTIVDFYVERIVNMPGAPTFAAVNGGRPYALFRINYEDVEQGNDHDMDAIVRYELLQKADGNIEINLATEYQAGSVVHHMGYVISGTTRDGVYLEVVDNEGTNTSTGATGYQRYKYDTPPGKWAGECLVTTDCPEISAGKLLPISASRTFSPGTTTGAELLKDPLWYAAKFGGFQDDKAQSGTIPGDGIPQLKEWDENGDGTPDNYFLVTNALTLKARLTEAFQAIEDRANPAGAVATNSTRVDSETLVYKASYRSKAWTGDVEAFRLDSTGKLVEPAVWSAAAKQPVAASRNIAFYSGMGGVKAKSFVVGGMTTAEQQLMYPELTGSPLVAAADATITRLRSREMGDVVGSSPALSGRQDFGYCVLPASAGGGGCVNSSAAAITTYGGYLQRVKRTRTPTLSVGVNDGTFRVLNGADSADGGTELFSFIPRGVMGNLRQLMVPNYISHRYFVDGSPTVGDAFLGGEWKTVVLGTLGAGGRSVFAIDITDPSAMGPNKVMWEFTDPDLGMTFGQARIARLSSGDWVAVFGNGYNSTNHRAFLFIVNLETGALIRKFDTGVGTESEPNGMATPLVIDTSGLEDSVNKLQQLAQQSTVAFDQTGDLIYAGDLQGNMWRIDVSTASSADWDFSFTSGPDKRPLYKATQALTPGPGVIPRPITSSPTVLAHPQGGVMVIFGTGQFFVNGDNVAEVGRYHTIYGIRDVKAVSGRNPGSPVTSNASRSNLLQQTIDTNVGDPNDRKVSIRNINLQTQNGWYMDFNPVPKSLRGERVLAQPIIRAGQLLYTTYAPIGTICEPLGDGYLMRVDALTGSGAFGTGGDNRDIRPTGSSGLDRGTGATATPGSAGGGSGIRLPAGTPPASVTIVGISGIPANTGGQNPVVPVGAMKPQPNECALLPTGVLCSVTIQGRQSWREMR